MRFTQSIAFNVKQRLGELRSSLLFSLRVMWRMTFTSSLLYQNVSVQLHPQCGSLLGSDNTHKRPEEYLQLS